MGNALVVSGHEKELMEVNSELYFLNKVHTLRKKLKALPTAAIKPRIATHFL
jgi:hypothetical protein